MDEASRTLARTLPGTLTYLDLIRRNRRASALLVASIVLVTGALGAAAIVLVRLDSGLSADPRTLLPSLMVGVIAGLVVAALASLASWFWGAAAILRLAGAREVTEAEDPMLVHVVDEMRIAAGLPMPRVFLVEDSALNAFATGRDPEHAAISVTRGLRDRLSRDELQGVVAHEMAHVRHLDVRFAMLMATLVGIVAAVSDGILRSSRYSRRRSSSGNGGSAAALVMVAAFLLAILAPLAARIVQLAYSREREYLADAGAVELTRDPTGLIGALKKIAADEEPFVDTANRGTAHLFIANPLDRARRVRRAKGSLFSSHPPIEERVARLMALMR